MRKQNPQYILWQTLLLILTFSITSCNPRNLPGIRQFGEQEGKRLTKVAEEMIEKEPVLRELNQLCTKEIPLYEGFSIIRIHSIGEKRNHLSYYYSSNADWRKVKAFYKDYFAQKEWRLGDEYDGGWGPNKVQVKKDKYTVILYNEGIGEDANYSFRCEISDTNKVE
jgi:hypothetical protein